VPILYHNININKIKVADSVGSGSNVVKIFKKSTCLDADLVYSTSAYFGDLVDPIENTGTTTTERNEGMVCFYENLDLAKVIYMKLTNNHTAAKVYTVTIEYSIQQRQALFNVKDFGAVGDGTTDDTAAIQAAIDAAFAITTASPNDMIEARGATVFIPEGFYLTDTLTLPSGVSILGAGTRATKLFNDFGTSSEGIVHSSSEYTGLFTLKDFSIEARVDVSGNRLNTVSGIRIQRNAGTPWNTGHVAIENVWVQHFGIGVKQIGVYTTTCKHVTTWNCNYGFEVIGLTGDSDANHRFETCDCYASGTYGFYLHTDTGLSTLVHYTFDNCWSASAGVNNWRLEGTGTHILHNMVFNNCYGENAAGSNWYISFVQTSVFNSVDSYTWDHLNITQMEIYNVRYCTFNSVSSVSNLTGGAKNLIFGQTTGTTTGNTFNACRFKGITLTHGWLDTTLNNVWDDATLITNDASFKNLTLIDGTSPTNPTNIKLYNTYTSGTNYERLAIEWQSNTAAISTYKGSGGGSTRALYFGVGNTYYWGLNTIGNFIPIVGDSTADIGQISPNFRPRDVHVARALNSYGRLQVAGENGEFTSFRHSTVQSGAMSGASLTLADLIPAGCIVFGVTVFETTPITSGDGGTTFTVVDEGSITTYASAVAFGTKVNLLNQAITAPKYYTAEKDLIINCNGGTFSGGVVRVTIHYLTLVAATS
jgi:hypothetical protein